jgi:hypothetical protein
MFVHQVGSPEQVFRLNQALRIRFPPSKSINDTIRQLSDVLDTVFDIGELTSDD